jgi:hypothetical protein
MNFWGTRIEEKAPESTKKRTATSADGRNSEASMDVVCSERLVECPGTVGGKPAMLVTGPMVRAGD